MELRHLRYFLVLAEELNFGRAAERLGIAQPPLSRQIHALETELGLALLSRAKRRVTLTDAGKVFQEEARVALECVERATTVTRRAGRVEVSRLSLGFGPVAELGVAPRLVRRFVQSHADVHLELHSLLTNDHLTALRDGVVQATLTVLPVGPHPDIAIERLAREPLAVAMSRRSPLAKRRSLTVQDVSREPLVMFPRQFSPGLHYAIGTAFRDAQVPLVVTHETTHLHLALALVSSGLGVTLLPRAATGLCSEGIVYRPLARQPTLEMGVMYRPDHSSEVLKKFLSMVREVTKRAATARQRPVATAS